VLRGFIGDPMGFALRCAREKGAIVELPIPGLPTVLISDPALIEQVLLKDHELYVKDHFTRLLTEVLGQGLLVSEGDFWRRQRRMMQPAFHHKRIAAYARIMVVETRAMCDAFRDGEERDVHAEMMHLTLRIVARALFGAGISDAQAKLVEAAIATMMQRYLGILGSGLVLPLSLPTPAARRFRRQMAELDILLLGIIERRRSALHAEAEASDDLLDMLLKMQDEDGARMSNAQLRDECMTLFLAGHETTALTLTYCVHLLGKDPAAEARLHQELDTVLAGRVPQVDDLQQLVFTRAVINESLRLYPPAWSIGREASTDTSLGGYRIRKGTQIWISPYIMHRDLAHFPDAETFRPERWLDGLEKELPRYVFMPFGGGPRICIGNAFALTEAVLALATIAQRMRLRLVDTRDPELVPTITLRPKGPLRACVERREADRHETRGQDSNPPRR